MDKKKIKIFFAYKHTDKPWGGANNFIRALYNGIKGNPDFIVHHDVNSDSDIFFFNQMSYGPGNVKSGGAKRYLLSEIREMKRKNKAKLIVRAVNLNINSHRPKGVLSLISYLKDGLFSDINTIRFLNMADFVIFQSEFQRLFFKKWGYTGLQNTVIHNGASDVFENKNFTTCDAHSPLRLVSNSNHKAFKKHELISKISSLEGVDIVHVGNWSDRIDRNKVNVRGTVTHQEIIKIYEESDYLLHPAILDPCPNSVIEALCFGLPVIYNEREGSSSEIVRKNGIAICEEDLKKTIQEARENFAMLKQKLGNNRDYYSIKRAVSMYINVFNKFKKE